MISAAVNAVPRIRLLDPVMAPLGRCHSRAQFPSPTRLQNRLHLHSTQVTPEIPEHLPGSVTGRLAETGRQSPIQTP